MKDLSTKLEAILLRHKEIELKLSDQNSLDTSILIKLNKEYADLTPLTKKIIDHKKCKKNTLHKFSKNLIQDLSIIHVIY